MDGVDDVESVGYLVGVVECFEERGEVMFLGWIGEEFKDGGWKIGLVLFVGGVEYGENEVFVWGVVGFDMFLCGFDIV